MYYNSSGLNKVIDNKAFWKTIKPFLSDKGTNINKITPSDNDTVISDDKQLCWTFSNFFQEPVQTLRVSGSFDMSNYSHRDPVNNAIRKYENYPSVKKMSETVTITSTLDFSVDDAADIKKSIDNLNSSKVGIFENIPTEYLKWLLNAAIWNQELTLLSCIRVIFHRHWWLKGQQGKEEDHLLFHSTTYNCSKTFRHLFATLHVRWL